LTVLIFLKLKSKQCHINADTWAAHNDGWVAVRGWVVFDMTKNPYLRPPRIHFAAHSVVRDLNGKLWDITPILASQAYPFFPHPGTNEEFEDIIARYKLEAVDYFPPE